MSAIGGGADIPYLRVEVCFWPIVLKKSFFAFDWKFSGPLVRLSRCEVRDHINCRKNDRWRSYRFCRALPGLKSPNALHSRDFRSPAIFEFFNTIGTERTWRDVRPESDFGGIAEVAFQDREGRFWPGADKANDGAQKALHALPEARPFTATEAHNQPAIRALSETIWALQTSEGREF
jgi:hypothetical protein